ncbi:ATP-binding protein [Methylomonas sp. UP202]|uniref:ATP-binding protein n=1 Tax=Methylomonas sp. UP202 TaxID=3040943 RepID=UPI0024794926|nr:ATP-binding protein [Methylomonas sp. UP202]WGS86174.1 ATP-binding protein [Methylomonas sp. UP202]
MSLAGVRSNRGDHYQTLIAFQWALSIYASDEYQWLEIDSTSLDAGGKTVSVDDIVIGCIDGSLICCQCKKNQKDFKPWLISDLGDELEKAAQFLADNQNSRVKFYSRNDFGALAKLREHARTQPNDKAYRQSLSSEHQKTDADLAKYLCNASGLTTYDWLQRTTFELSNEFEHAEELLKERLNNHVSNANTAFDVLWAKLDRLGARTYRSASSAQPSHRLTKADICEILEKSGATRVSPISQQELQHSFVNASAVGRHWRRDIAGKRLHIDTVDELIAAIESSDRSILVSGIPGSGKTCVLLELQEALENRADLASMFIQSREYANCLTPEARSAHGLPKDLVGVVGRMADRKPTVVIIDSLDVLSLSREYVVLSFFLAQIDRLLLIPNVTVIAACRDFDRKYDRHLAERSWDRTVSNKPLNWDVVVVPLISDCGIDPESLDLTTRSLLQNPRELAMFADIAKHTGGFNVTTSQALSRKYLETIVRNDPMLGDEAMVAIENIAGKMLKSRKLDVSRVQTQMSGDILQRLLSAEVLHENQSGNIEFGHQTLLDVLVVSGAERNEQPLKAFIEQLPAVPFVRPTIRAYVAYLAAGDRQSFRKQLRAVFDSEAAFHIKRLVAESFAEQIPQGDDWSLIKHLHNKHRELFNPLYMQAMSLEWHHFWLIYLVPYVFQERDGQSLVLHAKRIAQWKNADPSGVLNFWLLAMQQDWADRDQMAYTLAFELHDFDSSAEISAASLIETLLRFPHRDHDFFGHAVAHCIETGGGDDEMLWRYITGDIEEEDKQKYHFEKKLRCQYREFGKDDFLSQRMQESEHLLGLAINSVEDWSQICGAKYLSEKGWHDCFLLDTSYEKSHSRRDIGHASAETVLFKALEGAILHHAKHHTSWWQSNRQRLCCSKEGALRYFAILALSESPEHNIAEIKALVTDKDMLESRLSYEIGTLIAASFLFLDEQTQDTVQSSILTIRNDKDIKEHPWILTKCAELITVIPAHLRTPEAQTVLIGWEQSFGPCIRQQRIYSRGGWVSPPFTYERFFECTDAAVLRILAHYIEEGRSNWEHDFLVGGAEEVEGQLREATSRNPVRFMRMLSEYWRKIPDRFTDDILDGAATYLAYRFGNHHPSNNEWKPIDEPNPQVLASLILDELERHSAHWHDCRAAAKALEACANVIDDDQDASRLLFIAIGFLNFWEVENDWDDLIGVGINMARGKVAEAVMILATNWSEKCRQFPEILVPTLRRLARDPSSAIRALILRRLPYFQSYSPKLGWEIFHLALEDGDERLWVIAEPCLYYTYHNQFAQVSPILERIVTSTTGKSMEAWGRISALAAFLGHVSLNDFVARLCSLDSIDAWKGAASVWTHHENVAHHREQCFFGILKGLQQSGEIPISVAAEMSSLFRKNDPFTCVSLEIINLYFSAIEQKTTDQRFDLYGFDDWLNAISLNSPDEALATAERFTVFVRRSNHRLYDFGVFAQLLTRLFREAEEREESDQGVMLQRVIALQDSFLTIGVNGLQDWLRAAERP